MRRAILLFICGAAALSAQGLNPGDRSFALSELHASRKMFLDAIAGLSPAQWNFKPAPDRWSIAECAEHVALTEDFLFGRIEMALKSPASPRGQEAAAASNQQVIDQMRDRGPKFKNDQATQPTGRWATPAALSQYFRARRDRTLDFVRTTPADLRSHFASSAREAPDAFRLLLMLAGHTERHVGQIDEVKADPRFPKRAGQSTP